MNIENESSEAYPHKLSLPTIHSKALFEIFNDDMETSILNFNNSSAFSQVILEKLKNFDIFFDIGSSYGIDTIFSSKIVREVYSFEQDHIKFKILDLNIMNNDIKNVYGFPYKITNNPLLIETEEIENSPFAENTKKELGSSAHFESIDHLVDIRQIPVPTAIKINVNGEEFFVLQGMRKILSSEHRPRIIFLELHPGRLIQHGINFKEVIDFVENFGYVSVYQQNKFTQIQLIYEQKGTIDKPAKSDFMLFVPSNDTHVNWMIPIAEHIPGASFMVIPSRKENAGRALENHGINYYSFVSGLISVIKPSLIVLGIDWGAEELLIILEARLLNIPSVCIQEGPLLFNNIQKQLTHSDVAFIQGEVMRKYVNNKNIFVVGNPKYDNYQVEKLPQKPAVMINCNFTYGMYEDKRESWITDAISACKQCDVGYFVSQHPRDKEVFPSDIPVIRSNSTLVKDQIMRASIIISRFSTLIYEALLMGRRVIYYNPMREPYPIFENDNNGTLLIAHDLPELIRCVRLALAEPEIQYAKRKEYLLNHCGTLERKASLNCSATLRGIVNGSIPIVNEKRDSTASILMDAQQSLELGHLQRKNSWLDEMRKKDLEAIEELKAGNTWLEQIRQKDLEVIEELKTGNTWLEQMRQKDLEAIEELKTGNALLEQLHLNDLGVIEELKAGNIWLEQMRKQDLEAIEELKEGNNWLGEMHAKDLAAIEILNAEIARTRAEIWKNLYWELLKQIDL